MEFKKIKGNTFYLSPIFIDIGVYRLTEKECILIDTGFYKTARDEIIPLMKENDMKVVGILCTHGHIDHAGGNFLLKQEFDSQIAIPYVENYLCENSYNMYVLADNLRFREFGKTIPEFNYRADVIISPNYDNFYFMGVKFDVINIYGHSAYQRGYITPDNVAYLGDVLLSEDMLEKTKLPYIFDIGNDLQSKKRLKKLKCDKYILSHNGIYDDINDLIDKNIDHINSRMDILLGLLKKPIAFDDYTANIIKKMSIRNDLRKIIYIQRTIRGYLSYFQDKDLIDAFVEDNKIKFVKK